ncbi:hypothetical protein I308_103268 [Cryptococcus tetragattii IND107]|uniref:Secreted protein n=1 Tax=Cryptococcus tetragattii IND107 TaxID=1296105 RepID=A0ABR3BSN5_9TREE
MLYALGFLVLLFIIIVVWLVRLAILHANLAGRVFTGRYQSSSDSGPSPYCRGNDRGAVVRQSNGSEASLPAYGAESLPVPPETAYQPSQTRIRSDQTALNSVMIPEVPPPKYTAASEPVSTTRF